MKGLLEQFWKFMDNSALQLMALQIPTLFVCDPDGRLRYIAEPGYEEAELEPAPRFFMGRTLEGNLWRFRHDLHGDLVDQLERLCRLEPTATDLQNPPKLQAEIHAVLQTHLPIPEESRGPAYWLRDAVEPTGQAVVVTQANADLLDAHFPQWRTSRRGFVHGPMVAALEDNVAVSLCFCARFTPEAAEAGLETVEECRDRGHAVAATVLWASEVRQSGRLALYSTSWENKASQGVARRLGAEFYGEDWWIA